MLPPEAGTEEQQDGKQFQTADEHQHGATPLGGIRQTVPRIGRAYRTEARTDVAEAGHRDAKTFHESHADTQHVEPAQQENAHIGEEEGEQRGLDFPGDDHTVDAKREDGVRMKHVAKLIPHNLTQHGQADGLDGTARRARASTHYHGNAQHQPRA